MTVDFTSLPPRCVDLTPEVEAALAKYPKEDVFDGCVAAAHVAYACTDGTFIYPITPSTPMAEIYEVWSSAKRLNIFGQVCLVKQLQSEAGAAGAVHGGLSVGALTTTFTASQGLLLMIPPMYKIAGELLPAVFHVSARAVAGQALSIFGDHSDVMAVRQTGWALMASNSVQEAQDIAVIAHMATLKSRVPFVHFFDGFRTSHELQKISVLDYMTIRKLMDYEGIEAFRHACLNPTRPYTKGTAQGPEVYFQNVETSNKYYNACADHVEQAMAQFEAVVGRSYKLFEYYGCEDAEDVIVLMGSAAPIVEEAIDWLKENGQSKIGCLVVRLFRPWRLDRFIDALPKTTQRVCVLDRCKEPGSLGEPLYLDVAASLQKSKIFANVLVVGGRYGLGSRDFTPAMVMSVYDNLKAEEPLHGFSVGINDDVTNMSLDYSKYLSVDCVPAGTTQCMFWGMGSDGTVGANKNVIKILGSNTPLRVQGYFAYSAHKAGGLTVSHLRFGPKQIKSSYLLQACDYVAVHRAVYLKKYGCLDNIKKGGIFVLNCEWTNEQIEQELPGQMKKVIADKDVRMYAIDANKVAAENGMGRRINNVLMTSFFKVSGVLPFEQAIALFKGAIQKTYGKKGMHIVEANWKCVDAAVDATREIIFDKAAWSAAEPTINSKKLLATARANEPSPFVANVMVALETPTGVDLPVSAFMPFLGGAIPPGTAGYEKRAIAMNVPVVDMDKCTQCNQCSFVCPHAAVRPFLLDEEESQKAPASFISRKVKGPASLAAYKFRIQVSPLDCTGCELCFVACPDNALTMKTYAEVVEAEETNWDYAMQVTEKSDEVETDIRSTLKGSQFYTPLMEFSGACEGCGETPYVKLLTQLFGERLIIANATGCSSIWGASYPANAYTTNQKGQGPAWGNSLFEDAAEYGYGMAISTAQRRERLHMNVQRAVTEEAISSLMSEPLLAVLKKWLGNWKESVNCNDCYLAVKPLLPLEAHKHRLIADILSDADMFPRISQWIIGGDGWAYDIGFGGVDHVVASGVDINILVLDTEVYSNTGGQASKATPLGAVHKFATGGKLRNKKDLGAICMDYGDVYVASIASSANMTQTVRAFVEAESYEGTSIIMAYAPCIEHGYIKPFNTQVLHSKLAVDSGFWPLYRYDPRLLDQGESPFQLDSKKIKADLIDLVRTENRFISLKRANPVLCADLEIRLKQWTESRFEQMHVRAAGFKLQTPEVKPDDLYTILYGTDTATAESVSQRIASIFASRGIDSRVLNMADTTLEEVAAMVNVIVVCATAGQGQMPPNAKDLYIALKSQSDLNLFEHVRFSVVGLGDSSYVFFNQAARDFDGLFERLGGKRVVDLALCDDQHEEGYEFGFQEWLAEYLAEIKAPGPIDANDDPLPCAFKIAPAAEGVVCHQVVHDGFKLIEVTENRRMTPEEYEIDIRHLEFNLHGSRFKYQLGDSLAMVPINSNAQVEEFCSYFGFDVNQVVSVTSAGKALSKKYGALFGHPISVRQIFGECVTPFTKPTRSFYENVYRYATDPAEKATLKSVLEKDNRDMLKVWTNTETVNIFDVLKKFPSVRPTLVQMLDLVPVIKARYYSIASAQKSVGADNLHLCVGVVEWKTPSGENRVGEMTTGVKSFKTHDFVNAVIKPTCFNLPPTDLHPMIVAGMGTGLAPFRSFIQHRAAAKEQGREIGPLSVYFGCRYAKMDYLYQDEMEAHKASGVITELECAFSRDQKEKDYIQHHIVKNGQNFYQRLITEEGYFYLCGSAKQVPIDVRKAVRSVLVKFGNVTDEAAEELITDLQLKGRYNVEAW